MSNKGSQITLHKNRFSNMWVANLYYTGYFSDSKEFNNKDMALVQIRKWMKEYK
jgi:hypothetical protein